MAAARAIIDRFMEAAERAKLAPGELTVRGFGGRGRAKSTIRGWELRRDGTIALGEDGRIYRLTADLSILDRFRSVTPEEIEPPLVIGAGGRDGDSVELEIALDRVLPGWRS